MKTVYLAILALALGHAASAQQLPNQPATDSANANAPFMRFPTIPPLHLLKLDSASYLSKDDIKKNRKTIIMFFSPDCEHCKHQTEAILASFKNFKDIQIVMATYQPFSEMKDFYAHYHIADHPNILIGRDEKYSLPPFYRIRNLPYLALYDKKGKLITTFEGTQKVSALLDAFKEKK